MKSEWMDQQKKDKKRKEFWGTHQITQKGNLFEHIWIQRIGDSGPNVPTMRWEHKTIMKMISKGVNE